MKEKNNSFLKSTLRWFKNNKGVIGNFLFTWLPMIINISLCALLLFPWEDVSDNNTSISLPIKDRDAIIAIILISYVIIIAKNNFDLNNKVIKEVRKLQTFDADDFFIVRDELEPLSKIFEEANSIYFSGGHLSSVIVSQNDALNNFLLRGGKARFILPNPTNTYIIEQYAEKLMVNMTKEQFKELVLLSLKTKQRYKSNPNYDIDVRLYNTLPSFGLQIIESPSRNRIYVELYTLQTKLSERLLFPVTQHNSGEMYIRFRKQFVDLWNYSEKLEDVAGMENLLHK